MIEKTREGSFDQQVTTMHIIIRQEPLEDFFETMIIFQAITDYHQVCLLKTRGSRVAMKDQGSIKRVMT